ncbi:MAG: AAA family ATPase [Lachnospiraceae bacterium]|nr:AAA family ATPase [Lachnospiraceae bacterium]
MNIQEAKREIANTLRAYLRKDADGNYVFPAVRQRPILLMGPPGIGKTAIMEQVAEECRVGLVAYTMTHHTRQSAIGLPHIVKKNYGGQEFMATEYTLSEIIASVYETMGRSGCREGILFLDEINCVSETLAPTMLQLLQNKTFGNHRVPEGWVIVGAGNPPEYNKSVREFDVVTLDRVRQIDVEADLKVWLDYAREARVHGAVISYLTIKNDRFYVIDQEEERQAFVTARGWEDLSELLKSYEEAGIPFGADQAMQFLHEEEIARDFAAYCALYRKYGSDYGVSGLLAGDLSPAEYREKTALAAAGDFEERFTVVNLLLEQLQNDFCCYEREDRFVTRLHEILQQEGKVPEKSGTDEDARVLRRLEEMRLSTKEFHLHEKSAVQEHLRKLFQEDTDRREKMIADLHARLERAFGWLAECFGEDGPEMILFVSSLTRNARAMGFIARHGCAPYLKYSQALLFREREEELQRACRNLCLSEEDAQNAQK